MMGMKSHRHWHVLYLGANPGIDLIIETDRSIDLTAGNNHVTVHVIGTIEIEVAQETPIDGTLMDATPAPNGAIQSTMSKI